MTCETDPVLRYLEGLGSTLWGRAFDIHDEDGKEQARAFIQNLWRQLEAAEFDIQYEQIEVIEDA